jgi:hypothetical protein
MKLGGISSSEAALALVGAFGYTGRMSAPLTLQDAFDDPEHIPTWRHPSGPMALDWDDIEAVTPVVFVGGYRESAREAPPTLVSPPGCPECYGGACVYCSPGVHEPPSWFVSLPRAVFELVLLS